MDVEVAATSIHWHAVIAIARHAAKFGILIEVIAARSVTNQAKEIFVA